jgi:hypothetical protein
MKPWAVGRSQPCSDAKHAPSTGPVDWAPACLSTEKSTHYQAQKQTPSECRNHNASKESQMNAREGDGTGRPRLVAPRSITLKLRPVPPFIDLKIPTPAWRININAYNSCDQIYISGYTSRPHIMYAKEPSIIDMPSEPELPINSI